MLGRSGLGVLVLGGFFVGACGGQTDDGPAPIPREQFVDRLVDAVCGDIEQCCTTNRVAFDRALCDTNIRAGLASNLSSSKYGYDGAKAAECVAGFRAAPACDWIGGAVPACDQALVGLVPAGGACEKAAECAAAERFGATCESGVCVVHPRGKPGSPCAETCTEDSTSISCSISSSTSPTPSSDPGTAAATATCYTNDGLACASNGQCQPIPKLGEPCPDNQCADGAFCSYETRKCEPQKGEGEACSIYRECASPASCNGSRCVVKKPDGASCTSGEECEYDSCVQGKCGRSATDLAKYCAADFK